MESCTVFKAENSRKRRASASAEESAAKRQHSDEIQKFRLAWTATENKINKACDQVEHLNRKIEETKLRMCRAQKNCKMAAHASLQLQLTQYGQIRNAYYLYASKQAENLVRLHTSHNLPPSEEEAREAAKHLSTEEFRV